MEECANLQKCSFFKEYDKDEQMRKALQGYVNLYCKGMKQEVCVRKKVSKRQKEMQEAYGLSDSSYEWDVSNLFLNGKELWAQTSTKSEEKGILFDVFNIDGRYLDSFYLGHDRALLKVRGDNLFVLERDGEGTYSIVKYVVQDMNEND